MDYIIEWCNQNNGFLTAVLSMLTLIVSVIAVVVAIKAARLPYKKKVLVKAGQFFSEQDYGIHVTATNVGNRDLVVAVVCLEIGDQTCLNPRTFMESKVKLKCGETTSQYYTCDMLRNALNKIENESLKVYGVVKDSEGKEYNTKIGTVREIKRFLDL